MKHFLSSTIISAVLIAGSAVAQIVPPSGPAGNSAAASARAQDPGSGGAEDGRTAIAKLCAWAASVV
jgi:hypothetical protein